MSAASSSSSSSAYSLSLGVSATSDANLSKEQKLFNTLVGKIGQRRDALAAWEAIVSDFQLGFAGELTPLRVTAEELARRLILALDNRAGDDGLSISERKLVKSMLVGLLEERGDLSADAQLKAIFNRHSSTDYDEDSAQDMAAMKAELEALLGESLGKAQDFNSPEELMRAARRKVDAQEAREEARKQARTERRAERAKAKKPAAAEATVSRREALQAELNQSLREIYRKLASALHPDREPDPVLRARKTEMLQAVNQAYDKQDLLHLLEVQIQLQQLDHHALNNLADDRLKHYNKLLKEQLAELDQEVSQTQSQFMHGYGLRLGGPVTPENVMLTLRASITQQRSANAVAESDLAQFEELAAFKRWLKEAKRRVKEAEQEVQMFYR